MILWLGSKLLRLVWVVFAVLFWALPFWESGSQLFERATSINLFC